MAERHITVRGETYGLRTQGFITDPPEVEFKRWVKPLNECWIWEGSANNSGSPVWGTGQRMLGTMNARKCSAILFKQIPDPPAQAVNCGNEMCVRPEHLEDKKKTKLEIIKETVDEETVRKAAILFSLGFSEEDIRRCLLGIEDEEINLALIRKTEKLEPEFEGN